MRKFFILLILSYCYAPLYAQFRPCSEWALVKGGEGESEASFGTKGVASLSNTPGARLAHSTWTDASGRLYLFGGAGYIAGGTAGYLNDIWRFDPTSSQWTWIQGSNDINQNPVYGQQGLASPANTPGARAYASLWQTEGKIFLYGGNNLYDNYSTMWRYDISTNQWTWISGSTTLNQGAFYSGVNVASPENTPGSRMASSTWVDAAGSLWLFGGYDAYGQFFNDLWRFDPTTSMWVVVQPNTFDYKTKPGRRYHAFEWKDAEGNFWLFGGFGATSLAGSLNDIWKYTPSTNQWTLIKGNKVIAATANYGTQGIPSPDNTPGGRFAGISFQDAQNNLWLLGGIKEANGEGTYNDLWKFDPTTSNWTWMKGDMQPNTPSVYNVEGTADPANKPGSRHSSAAWQDTLGNLWLFGGVSGFVYLNDLWKLSVVKTYYRDVDGDGFGNPAISVSDCTAPTGYVSNNKDCNDADKNSYPNAPELADDIDNNCNGQIDEGSAAATWYRDYDKDGFGDPKRVIVSRTQPAGYVANKLDCNDYAATYEDKDNDGRGSMVKVPCSQIYRSDDCNDNDRRVHTPQTFYRDADGDSWGNPDVTKVVCSSIPPTGYVKNKMDCNDNDRTIRYCPPASLTSTKGNVQELTEMAKSGIQFTASPNPFRQLMLIQFTLPQEARVSITLIDVLGREIGILVNSDRGAGAHTIDYRSSSIVSGVYYLQFIATTKAQVVTQNLKLMKTD